MIPRITLIKQRIIECNPYWNKTVLAMHMNGVGGSTPATAAVGGQFITRGGVAFGVSSDSFNTTPTFFDGTGDIIATTNNTELDFHTDFEISCFFKLNNNTSEYALCGKWGEYGGTRGFLFTVTSGGFRFAYGDGNYAGIFTPWCIIEANVRYHVRVTRLGSILRIYLNHTLVGETTITTHIHANQPLAIGVNADMLTHRFNGYIEELLIINGVAPNWDNNVVPNKPFVVVQCA